MSNCYYCSPERQNDRSGR